MSTKLNLVYDHQAHEYYVCTEDSIHEATAHWVAIQGEGERINQNIDTNTRALEAWRKLRSDEKSSFKGLKDFVVFWKENEANVDTEV